MYILLIHGKNFQIVAITTIGKKKYIHANKGSIHFHRWLISKLSVFPWDGGIFINGIINTSPVHMTILMVLFGLNPNCLINDNACINI